MKNFWLWMVFGAIKCVSIIFDTLTARMMIVQNKTVNNSIEMEIKS